MTLKEIICASTAAATVISGCVDSKVEVSMDESNLPTPKNWNFNSLNPLMKEYLISQMKSGNSYDGNWSQRECKLSGETEPRQTYRDFFTENGHNFVSMAHPLKSGGYYLQLFIDDCVAIDWDNDPTPELAILMSEPYQLPESKRDVLLAPEESKEVGRFASGKINDGLKEDAKELYTAMLNLFYERMREGSVSNSSVFTFRVAQARFANAIEDANER